MIKGNDIALIILITAIAMMASFFVGNSLISSSGVRETKVQIVERISDEFPEPDPEIFNDRAINPTRKVEIGGSQSEKPFTDEDN